MRLQKPFSKVAHGLTSHAYLSILMGILALTANTLASNYYVDTSTQFNSGQDKNGSTFTTLRTGDRVYLKGGTNWGGIVQTLTGSMTDSNAMTNPAIVYACDTNYVPSVGSVIINGVSQINLAGTGIVFAGVTFSSNSGMLPTGNATDYDDTGQTAWLISTAGGSRYNTISHIKFDHCGVTCTNTNDHYGPWVMMYGYHNTLQYCDIQGRDFNTNDKYVTDNGWNRTSIRDGTVVVLMQTADTVQWGHHTIRYNYFGPKNIGLNNDTNYYAPTDGAGTNQANNFYEVVRLGVGGQASNTFGCIVENNAFYHALWSVYPTNYPNYDNIAESEMISVKSRGNIIRNNTCLNSMGEISLRQNDYSTVEGNFVFGGGAYDTNGNIVINEPVSANMGGCRSFGFGNIIANNYFYNLVGSSLSSALALGEGISLTGTLTNLNVGIPTNSSTFYPTANYNWVMGNTFYNCVTICLDLQRQTYTNTVYGTRFLNNLIYYGSNSVNGTTGTGISGQNTDSLTNHGGLAYGNFIYAPNSTQLGSAATILGTASNTITLVTNPLLTGNYDAIYVPASNSPVIGMGYAIPPAIDTSSEATNHDLAGYVANFGAIDMRGLARPVSGQELGNYQASALGTGARPLHRYEVGIIASTYYPILLPSTNVSVTVSNLSQTYSGNAASQATSTTTPFNIPVTYTYNGSSNTPTNAGTYSVVAAVFDPIYGGKTTTNLVIAKVNPSINISSNPVPYTGGPISAVAQITPANIPVAFTYENPTYQSSTNPPTNAGTYSVRALISAGTSWNEATTNGSLIIASTPAIVSSTNTIALQGQSFVYQITALNNPIGFSASNLPTGLTLNTNTGLITGTLSNLATNTFSIIAYNSLGSSTTLMQLVTTNSVYSYTNAGPNTWLCPSNVTSVQIQCWGGGGAGGGASNSSTKNSYAGGGAGGSYAKNASQSVTPGTTYYVAVGAGGISSLTAGTNGGGGNSWFNSSNIISNALVVSQGGAGGSNAISSNSSVNGVGGAGSTNNSLGGLLYSGGSGASGSSANGSGGGGAGAGTNGNGATATNYVGATNTWGTGTGGTGTNNNSQIGGNGTAPGGGGGGARNTQANSGLLGGAGASGQVVITVTNLTATVTLGSLTQTYDGTPKAVTASSSPSNIPVATSYSGISPTIYPASSSAPTNAGRYLVNTLTTNSIYIGSGSGTMTILPITPSISLTGSTNNPFNGYPWTINASASPAWLPYTITYNGSQDPPSTSGTYSVVGTISPDSLNSNWNTATATSSMTIYDPVSSWRQSTYGTSNNSGSAADTASPYGIGLNNLQAYTFGVDPTQPVATPLLSISNSGSNTLTLSFLARAAGSGTGYSGLTRYYNLEATTNLTDPNSWSPVAGYSNIPSSNQVISLPINTTGGPKWFYRLKAWLQ
jgi:hypothetical protein